jgi:hypothetical protein
MGHIETLKSINYDFVCEEILGLWNLWEGYPEERKGIEDFMLKVIKDPETHPVTRVSLIADFAQLGRRDLKPLFESFCERREKDFDILAREDLDYFFDSVHCVQLPITTLRAFIVLRRSKPGRNAPKKKRSPRWSKSSSWKMLVVSQRMISVMVQAKV